VCTHVRMYVYGDRKGESKLHVLCSRLSTGLIMFDNQSDPDWLHFPVHSITQDERRDKNLISLGCLIHVSLLASHVRDWMSVCFVKRLNVQSEHHSLNGLMIYFSQSVRINSCSIMRVPSVNRSITFKCTYRK